MGHFSQFRGLAHDVVTTGENENRKRGTTVVQCMQRGSIVISTEVLYHIEDNQLSSAVTITSRNRSPHCSSTTAVGCTGPLLESDQGIKVPHCSSRDHAHRLLDFM